VVAPGEHAPTDPAPVDHAPADPVRDGHGGADPVDWRRLHRVTPALNAWKSAAVIIAVVLWNSADQLSELPLSFAQKALGVVGLVVLGAAVGLVYGTIAWRRTQYAISRDRVLLHSGVLWRQQRHVRLDRLQAVDVTQPLLARLFGFASLKIESAGGAGSNLNLSYLTEDEAQRVRNEILARAAGVQPEQHGSGSAPAPARAGATAAPERPLLELTAGRLVASLLRSAGVLAAVLLLVGLVVGVVVTGTFRFVAGAIPAVIGAATYVWSRFSGEFAFRIGISADGIRLRHGLIESKARTVPPGRVQAISLSQSPLWRSKGWWRLRMNVAGYVGESQDSTTVLYPVATTQEVEQLLPLVLPDLGADRPLDVLHAAMNGTGEAEGFITSPARARLYDPFSWRRNGLKVTRTAVLLRTGVWWRSVAVVPHERTQSLVMTQGPLERRRDLAGVTLHSTPGPVQASAVHLDAGVARTLLLEQAERARQARRLAGPERWMRNDARAAEPATAAALRAGYAGALPATPDRGRFA